MRKFCNLDKHGERVIVVVVSFFFSEDKTSESDRFFHCICWNILERLKSMNVGLKWIELSALPCKNEVF